MNKQTLQRSGAVLLAILVWQAAASIVGMDMLLASPLMVFLRLFTLWFEDGFVYTVLYSMIRISGGFLCAFVAGIILALLAGRFHIIEILLWPYITAIKAVPVASFIILCLIWFSYSQLTVFIAFLIAFPVIYTNVLHGLKSTDLNLREMADLYAVPWSRRLLYIYLPSVKPFLVSATGISMGMAWKAGVAAEVIGVVDGSIGEKLYNAKIYFQNPDLLAWTIVIIILSIVFEKLFVFLLKALYAGLEKL